MAVGMDEALLVLEPVGLTGEQLSGSGQKALDIVRVGYRQDGGEQELLLRVSQQLAKGSVNF
jgi:hypothetical protein